MATSASMAGFHCGDRVRLRNDARHEGKVIAVIYNRVRVAWSSTTWISDEDPRELERLSCLKPRWLRS